MFAYLFYKLFSMFKCYYYLLHLETKSGKLYIASFSVTVNIFIKHTSQLLLLQNRK